jgi:hypothetical protein
VYRLCRNGVKNFLPGSAACLSLKRTLAIAYFDLGFKPHQLMKRRTFIWLSAAGVASLYIPAAGCSGRYKLANKTIAQPQFLAHICEEKTIKEIGTSYKQQIPAEKEDRKLAHLILRDTNGHAIPESTESNKLEDLIAQKIQQDFEHGRTVVVKGWVLSQTEARQCALFSSQA